MKNRLLLITLLIFFFYNARAQWQIIPGTDSSHCYEIEITADYLFACYDKNDSILIRFDLSNNYQQLLLEKDSVTPFQFWARDLYAIDNHIIFGDQISIYFSHDYGITWSKCPFNFVISLESIVAKDSMVCFARFDEIYKTTDFGNSYSKVYENYYSSGLRPLLIKDSLLYFTGNGKLKRIDLYQGLLPDTLWDPQGPLFSMISVGNKILASSYYDLFQSIDGGSTWDTIHSNFGYYFKELVIRDSILFVSGYTQGLQVSQDTGYTFAPANRDLPDGAYLQSVRFHNQNIYVNTVKGIYYRPISEVMFPNVGVDSIVACDSLLWIDNKYYSSSIEGPTHVLTNVLGCDSTVTLKLQIIHSSHDTVYIDTCSPYTWVDGNTYTSSNYSATDTFQNIAGCDSVIHLHLTINSSFTTDSVTSCGPYTWINGITYYNNINTVTDTFTNNMGCDSVVLLVLTIDSLDTDVTVNGSTLLSNLTGGNYQWLNCNNGYALIPGETSQQFIPSVNGSYAVEINKNNCTDTSACIQITGIGVESNDSFRKIRVSPNPTEGQLVIFFDHEIENAELFIISSTGEVIQKREIISSSQISTEIIGSPGVYYIKVVEQSGETFTVQIMKF